MKTYTPVIDGMEVARELVDIVQVKTNAPVEKCADAVTYMLNALIHVMPEASELREIREALESDDFIDLERCYDARCWKSLIETINVEIRSDPRNDQYSSEEEDLLVNTVHELGKVVARADERVTKKYVRQDDFSVVSKIVHYFNNEYKDYIRCLILTVLYMICTVDRAARTFLLNGDLPTALVRQQLYIAPLSEFEVLALKLLGILFTSGEKFPVSHYDSFDVAFISKILFLANDNNEAFNFILSFNAHFEPFERNVVIQALNLSELRLGKFSHVLASKVNECRADHRDMRALKLLGDICRDKHGLALSLFFNNDLKVLYGILCQELMDTNQIPKMELIVDILENTSIMERCDVVRDVQSRLMEFLKISGVPRGIKRAVAGILDALSKKVDDTGNTKIKARHSH